MENTLKQLLLITTGGTIACEATRAGMKPGAKAHELLAYAETNGFSINVIELMSTDSTNIQPDHWLKIARTIEDNYKNYDGFVITHGTDTLAYTAAMLSYLLQNFKKPVVLTGAQLPMQAKDSDGPRNLTDSLYYAAHGIGGVYIAFNGQIIAGTRAKKIRTKSLNAFESINLPPAALIDTDRIIYSKGVKPAAAGEDEIFYHALNPSVFVLKLFPGIKPEILTWLGTQYKAIIVEAYGVGGLPFHERSNLLQAAADLAGQNVLIVLATQVLYEGTDAKVYEVGAAALQSSNTLQLYDMTIEAAFAKLTWILAQTEDIEEVKEKFYSPVFYDLKGAEH